LLQGRTNLQRVRKGSKTPSAQWQPRRLQLKGKRGAKEGGGKRQEKCSKNPNRREDD
jgi:hypothetical protein